MEIKALFSPRNMTLGAFAVAATAVMGGLIHESTREDPVKEAAAADTVRAVSNAIRLVQKACINKSTPPEVKCVIESATSGSNVSSTYRAATGVEKRTNYEITMPGTDATETTEKVSVSINSKQGKIGTVYVTDAITDGKGNKSADSNFIYLGEVDKSCNTSGKGLYENADTRGKCFTVLKTADALK